MSAVSQKLPSRRWLEVMAFVAILMMSLSLLVVSSSSTVKLELDQGQLVYNGQVKNQRPEGKGVLEYANGDRYEGEFKNGAFHGQGTFRSHTGWVYTGEFKKGQADGKGVLQTETKAVYEGTFKQGIYQK